MFAKRLRGWDLRQAQETLGSVCSYVRKVVLACRA